MQLHLRVASTYYPHIYSHFDHSIADFSWANQVI